MNATPTAAPTPGMAPPHAPRAVVLGAGLAGIAAALRLAEHGLAVTVLETSKRLGGRASSFTDRATGQSVDNCQHVLMRSCTNLLDLYRRLGVDQRIAWHDTLHFADRAGRIAALRADDLPAPMHLLRPWLRFDLLTPRTRLAISRGMMAVMRTPASAMASLNEISFAHWLRQHRQPAEAIDRFWRVVIVSACNQSLDRVAANYALKVFREGFLNRPDAYHVGLPTVPLRELYDPAAEAIERAGGAVTLGASVQRLVFEGGQVRSVKLSDGREVAGDVFVSALPFDRLDRAATDAMKAADARLARLSEMTLSPIIGVHMHFARRAGQPVMGLPHLALLDSPLHWVFNKGAAPDPGRSTRSPPMAMGGLGPTTDTPTQHLHGVISAAHDLVDWTSDAIVEMAVAELGKVLPRARRAALVHGRAVKEKRATFSAHPGVDALRPAASGTIPNLKLAGDWCDTGWPATMEGAVRSGYRAAAEALAALGRPVGDLLTPDAPPGAVYRLIAR